MSLFSRIIITISLFFGLIAFSFASNQVQNDIFWRNFSNQLKLNHADSNPRVQREIKIMLANKAKFNQILKASTRYMPYIYTQTQALKMPAEIALVPFIESEFNPNDRSLVGARGLWQLMPGTARLFGLKTGGKNDDRMNLPASTKAALGFFKDLNTHYKGNWELILAAYNSGQGRVDKAIRRAGSRNYYALSLPSETKIYVPKLMAVATILKNPEKYNITLPVMV